MMIKGSGRLWPFDLLRIKAKHLISPTSTERVKTAKKSVGRWASHRRSSFVFIVLLIKPWKLPNAHIIQKQKTDLFDLLAPATHKNMSEKLTGQGQN